MNKNCIFFKIYHKTKLEDHKLSEMSVIPTLHSLHVGICGKKLKCTKLM
jgi:hypothetical protein